MGTALITFRSLIYEQTQKFLPPGSLRLRCASAAYWALVGSTLSRALSLGTWMVCARVLGVSAFGGLNMVQSTAGTLGTLAGLGLGLTATRYVAEYRVSAPQRAGCILSLSQLMAVTAGAGVTISLVWLAPRLSTAVLAQPALATPLAIGGGLVFFSSLNGYQTGALAGLEAFRTIAHVSLWCGLCSFPVILLGVWTYGLNGAVSGMVFAVGLNCVLNHLALRRECIRSGIQPSLSGCWKEIPILYHFSLPSLLTSALISPATWLCNAWLVRHKAGYVELGLYGAADRWRLAILFVPASVFGTILPMLSNMRGAGDFSGFQKVFRANVLFTSSLVVLPTIVITILSQPIMSMYGPGYRRGWLVLIVLCLSALPETLNTSLGQPLITESMWRRLSFNILLTGLLLLTGWALIPPLGALGLALAYGGSLTITSAALFLYVRRRLTMAC
jgi:O-antigen/teichoic acid export membrane protein